MTAADSVPDSLMPKGVEHQSLQAMPGPSWIVPDSLMPKGVEHIFDEPIDEYHDNVPDSLMPKGVEHTTYQGEGWAGQMCLIP